MKAILIIFFCVSSLCIYSQENQDVLLRNYKFYHKREYLYNEIRSIIHTTLTEEVKSSKFMIDLENRMGIKLNSIESVLSVYSNRELLGLNESDRLNIIKF